MSTIRANIITDRAGTGAPNFPEGIQIGGSPSIANRTIVGTADQITVTNGDGADGNPTIAAVIASKAEAEAGTNSTKLMTSERTKEAFNASLNVSGSTPTFAARAWANFNGVTTVTIGASGNISSITRNSAGDYTLNFDTAMPNANYAVAFATVGASTTNLTTTAVIRGASLTTVELKSTTQLRFQTGSSAAATVADNINISAIIFN